MYGLLLISRRMTEYACTLVPAEVHAVFHGLPEARAVAGYGTDVWLDGFHPVDALLCLLLVILGVRLKQGI